MTIVASPYQPNNNAITTNMHTRHANTISLTILRTLPVLHAPFGDTPTVFLSAGHFRTIFFICTKFLYTLKTSTDGKNMSHLMVHLEIHLSDFVHDCCNSCTVCQTFFSCFILVTLSSSCCDCHLHYTPHHTMVQMFPLCYTVASITHHTIQWYPFTIFVIAVIMFVLVVNVQLS